MTQKTSPCLIAALLGLLSLNAPAYAAADDFNPDSIRSFVDQNHDQLTDNEADRIRFGTVSLLAALIHDKAMTDFAGVSDLVTPEVFAKLTPQIPDAALAALWGQFFEASVILVGDGLSDQPVLGYYNTLVDSFVIVQLKRQGEKLQATDMFAVSGKSLRGRAQVSMASATPLPSPILATYKASADAFAKLYPALGRRHARTAFDHNTASDLRDLLARTAMIQNQTARINQSAAFVALVDAFKTAAGAGNTAKLQSLFPDNTISPPEWVANIPASVRRSLKIVGVFQPQQGTYQVALMSPTATRLVVLLDVADGAPPHLQNLVLSDYSLLSRSN